MYDYPRSDSEFVRNDMIENIQRCCQSGTELYILEIPAMLVLIVKETYGGLSWDIHFNNVSLWPKIQWIAPVGICSMFETTHISTNWYTI